MVKFGLIRRRFLGRLSFRVGVDVRHVCVECEYGSDASEMRPYSLGVPCSKLPMNSQDSAAT